MVAACLYFMSVHQKLSEGKSRQHETIFDWKINTPEIIAKISLPKVEEFKLLFFTHNILRSGIGRKRSRRWIFIRHFFIINKCLVVSCIKSLVAVNRWSNGLKITLSRLKIKRKEAQIMLSGEKIRNPKWYSQFLGCCDNDQFDELYKIINDFQSWQTDWKCHR